MLISPYDAQELTLDALEPVRYAAGVTEFVAGYIPGASWLEASAHMLGSIRHYPKREFDIKNTVSEGNTIAVKTTATNLSPFCNLLHLKPDTAASLPRVLVVAPLAGHFATLLRGTVVKLLEDHEVYVTDWVNARDVSLLHGRFGFDDFVNTLIKALRFIGPDLNVVGVCQPGPGLIAATALMAEDKDPCQPLSLVLISSPIDTRIAPTEVNNLAKSHDLSWFDRNVITSVHPRYNGQYRRIYPGLYQQAAFWFMNLDRHVSAQWDIAKQIAANDRAAAQKTIEFYNEFNAVMDLPADFYLDTIKRVFHEHNLPRGNLYVQNRLVKPELIKRTALMTVEGKRDDICGIGQTEAAHDLLSSVPKYAKAHTEENVGHLGGFTGSEWENVIYPKVRAFMHEAKALGIAQPLRLH